MSLKQVIFKQWIKSQVKDIELVILQPTPFCNLKCNYCYLATKDDKSRMSLETLQAILDRIEENAHLLNDRATLCWHAGEPLAVPIATYEKYYELIRGLQERLEKNFGKKLETNFQTNGTLIDEKWIDFFKSQKRLSVGISLDGSARLHNLNRVSRTGAGSFDKAIRGLKLLQSAGFKPNVISVITEEAMKNPEELFEFYSENNITDVSFNIEEKEGTNKRSLGHREAVGQNVGRFFKKFLELNHRAGWPLKVREFDYARSFLQGLSPHQAKFVSRELGQLTRPLGIITISRSGDMSTYDPEIIGWKDENHGNFIYGNVHQHSFNDILENENFLKVSREIHAGINACKATCPIFKSCGGGCAVNKYFENGSFNSTKTDFCYFNRTVLLNTYVQFLKENVYQQRNTN